MKINLQILVPAILVLGAIFAVGGMVYLDYQTIQSDHKETMKVMKDDSGPSLASVPEANKHA